MQIFETVSREEYNRFLLNCGGSVLQSWAWGEFQKKVGRKIWRLSVTTDTGKNLAAALLVKMPLPRGHSYFYCPRGPVVAGNANENKIWQLLLDKISDLAAFEQPIFLRIDPPINNAATADTWRQLGFAKTAAETQPKETLLLNLQQTEEQLLHGMKPKTRYNINLAQKKGVAVEQYSDGTKTRIFWEMLTQTTARDGFSAHPFLYYYNILEVLGKSGNARLLIASYHSRALAGAILAFFGPTAIYLHGASSDRLRNTMAPYLLQWTAIKSAMAAGAKSYDFGGVAPEDATASHAWAGISRFKKGFGGQPIEYLGAYDLIYRPGWHRLYNWARRLRRVW